MHFLIFLSSLLLLGLEQEAAKAAKKAEAEAKKAEKVSFFLVGCLVQVPSP